MKIIRANKMFETRNYHGIEFIYEKPCLCATDASGEAYLYMPTGLYTYPITITVHGDHFEITEIVNDEGRPILVKSVNLGRFEFDSPTPTWRDSIEFYEANFYDSVGN